MLAKATSIARRFSTTAKRNNYYDEKNPLRKILTEQIEQIKKAGTYKKERVITSPQTASITVEGATKPVLNFCANNYLGLSSHPEIIKAAHEALDTHGFGMSSVRFICGTQDIHKQLEKTISDFHRTEDTILYPSAFDANAGLFEGILTDEDAVISDALNHASIIDGIRLCKAKRFRYKHLDMQDLEEKLQQTQDSRIRLIATDGVFSMDGDLAPLDKIVELAEKYNANIFIDECHATGFFGKTGRGTPEYFGVEGKIDIINSTLGKALGGASGGYTSGRKEIVDILRQKARPYLFSNTLAPPIVGASLKTFEILTRGTELRDKLMANTKQFRSAMTKAGFNIIGNPECPIVPVMLGDARLAADFADDMLTRGIYVIGFSYPVVPKDQARIRVQLSAAHTPEQIEETVNAFIEVGKKRGVIA
eukprot:GEZU01013566.1.p1 GENE.GEZU01013566.1~~GEZU01013566.1.p1  ORF type:complete len:457 (+),score=167.71 GEZU01013566.1:107-1372(+)